jgi:uncharacterized membrane protein
MKNIITVLIVLVGILSWNSAYFDMDKSNGYEFLCACIFILTACGFVFWMILSDDLE